MEHLADLAPLVHILDAPVPQRVDNVMDAFRPLDRPIAEQVIEVPKISCSPCPSRVHILVPQMAEHLVEVPSPALLQQQTVEQPIHIPVPRDHGGRRLQGSLLGQETTASGAEQIAVTPVLGRGISGGLQGLRRGQDSTAFVESSSQQTAAQIADIPAPSRDSRSFPSQSSNSHAFGGADHRVLRSPSFRGPEHHDDPGTGFSRCWGGGAENDAPQRPRSRRLAANL